MKTAIYCRKSTLQRGDEDTRSIPRQIADARAFAGRMGLGNVDDLHVYTDDAVSGADVKNLRARARLIGDVEAGKITTVIMADMSRFSRREGHEVVAELKQIAKKAQVYFYETGQRFVFGDIGTNIANYAVAEANADYRRKIRTKTKAAQSAKAQAGHVLGPPAFGYKHVDVPTGATDGSGRPIRSHVTREIFEPQAAVVREIYTRYAAGEGLKKIALILNEKGVPTPRPRKAKGLDGKVTPIRPAAWAASNVRSILRQPLYRGVAVWNRLNQHDEDGPKKATINPVDEWIQHFDPRWQIIDNVLADKVEALFRDEERQKFKGRVGAKAKYLLSGGLLLCPECGGRFEALNKRYYVCATRRHAGTSRCSNALALRIDILDEAVLSMLDQQVLHPAFIAQVLDMAFGNRSDDGRHELERQRDQANAEIKALVAMGIRMAAQGVDVPEIDAKMKEVTADRDRLERRLAAIQEPIDRAQLEAALNTRAAEWRTRLRSEHPAEARFIVQQLIGPITLWSGTAADFDTADGYDADDRRGKENLDPEDLGLRAVVTPLGLLNGLAAPGAFSMVAGARLALYRKLCWAAA